ncbi:hypothetical protein L208DRAFT_1261170 [Tricholoma matsutake]|nr:hypothetical protein L208DRAFT_1261170 [Tricholoma matsutake 945]
MTCHRLWVLAAEVMRVMLEAGSQGRLGSQAHIPDVEGVWFEFVQNVSNRIFPCFHSNLTYLGYFRRLRFREGEMSTLKGTVNSMVDQLSTFTLEVTRVVLEVGMQGILGGQAYVEGVQETWANLTQNMNICKMASKLTDQVHSKFVVWLWETRRFWQAGKHCAGRDARFEHPCK